MKVFGEEQAQLLPILRPTTKEALTRLDKVLKLFVILVVKYLLLEKLPQPLHQIQIR